MNIFASRPVPPDLLETFSDHGWCVNVRGIDSRCPIDEMRGYAENADALLLSGTDVVDRSVLEIVKNLKVIACCSVGFDNVDIDEASSRGIVVCNAPSPELIAATAESATALLLSVAKRITRLHNCHGKNLPPYSIATQMGLPVRRRVSGIVGAGRIGSAIARIMHQAFDNRILYFARSEKPDLEKTVGAERREINVLLAESDFVFVAVPLTDATKHLLSEQRLQQIKQDAIIVNVARAGVIDDAALVQQLANGRLFGAGLDVYERAATTSDHPNLVLTSHMANGENVSLRATVELAIANIVAVLSGARPLTPVTD
jgi:lactate dehydrogenase-like 2-hydroxyacid dehydrogenase